MGNLKVGDIIISEYSHQFIGASNIHHHALILSIDPMVLSSIDGYSIWKDIKDTYKLKKIGEITDHKIIENCFKSADMSYINYIREINLNAILYQIDDLVNLPFNEKGIIINIDESLMWGFKYSVKITEGSVFNEIGDIVQFKSEQFL